jgi:hypothetical protein
MRRKRGPYSKSRYATRVRLLAANIEHLIGAQGFDIALAALLMELERMARRGAYRPKIALALLMLGRRLDDYGHSLIPSVAEVPHLYVGIDVARAASVGVRATLEGGRLTDIEVLEEDGA